SSAYSKSKIPVRRTHSAPPRGTQPVFKWCRMAVSGAHRAAVVKLGQLRAAHTMESGLPIGERALDLSGQDRPNLFSVVFFRFGHTRRVQGTVRRCRSATRSA